MIIEDLVRLGHGLPESGLQPEMNPLTEEDALQKAQLLDFRFDALTRTVTLLFELRMALQLRRGNTGVLVGRGVRGFTWSSGSRSTRLTAWTVGGSIPSLEKGLFNLKLGLWPGPGAQLSVTAESATFFVGDVPGLDEVAPDYSDEVASVRARIAGWQSDFLPIAVVRLQAASPFTEYREFNTDEA